MGFHITSLPLFFRSDENPPTWRFGPPNGSSLYNDDPPSPPLLRDDDGAAHDGDGLSRYDDAPFRDDDTINPSLLMVRSTEKSIASSVIECKSFDFFVLNRRREK
jgi:hypothetical protein